MYLPFRIPLCSLILLFCPCKSYSKNKFLEFGELNFQSCVFSKGRNETYQNIAPRGGGSGFARVQRQQHLSVKSDNSPLLKNVARRAFHFWHGAGKIYFSYKILQAKTFIQSIFICDKYERDMRKKTVFDKLHEINSEKMLNLCLELQGFYLKSGQYFGTRHDFMPEAYLRKLGTLHDQVPPMPAQKVQALIEKELSAPLNSVFKSINLEEPVGSASLSQVHEGVLRISGERVAVKVQYPHAKTMMKSDLKNLRRAFTYLERFEIKQDLVTPIKELENQIDKEFDFKREAGAMDHMCLAMKAAKMSNIMVPMTRFASSRLLIMTFLDGVPLSRLSKQISDNIFEEVIDIRRKRSFIGKAVAKRMLSALAKAWGHMVFNEGLFNADPHPGNILLMPGRKFGLLDWGQTKTIDLNLRYKIARTIRALKQNDADTIVQCFYDLGFEVQNPEDKISIQKMVRAMFDTRGKVDMSPFSEHSLLKINPVTQIPADMYFVLRAVQMFRGMSSKVGVDFSLADAWSPFADAVLRNYLVPVSSTPTS